MKGIPQAIVIALYAMAIGITMGEVNEGKATSKDVRNRVITTALLMGLLWWGGFFS